MEKKGSRMRGGRQMGGDEKKRRRHVSISRASSGGLPFIIYGNVSRECSPSQTTLSTAASEIRPRFGKAAGNFIFLPFVLASQRRVRACV